jgi:hypothetical protein
MSSTESPYLFIALGSAEKAQDARREGRLVTELGGTYWDATPFFGILGEYADAIGQFHRSPFNPQSVLRLNNIATRALPTMRQMVKAPAPVKQALLPLATSFGRLVQGSRTLLQNRMRQYTKITQAPTLLLPWGVTLAPGATVNGVQFRNPYLGVTGGMLGGDGSYKNPWSITSVRTSFNENGQLDPIKIPVFLLAGHDYVAASLGGVLFTAGGAPAVQGWPAAAFSESKTSNWRTEIQPWNVVAQHGGLGTGFGSIMTETGFLQVSMHNAGVATYVATWSVYVRATMCDNPFGSAKYTDTSLWKSSIAPLRLQFPLHMKLAGDVDQWLEGSVSMDDDRYTSNAGTWVTRMEGVHKVLGDILDEDDDMMLGEWRGHQDPSRYGFRQLEAGSGGQGGLFGPG